MQDSNTDAELLNIVCFNFRMPEICASLGIAQLKKLDSINLQRNNNANYLIERLQHIAGLCPPEINSNVDWVCHILAFLFDKDRIGFSRDLFVACLRAEGIPVGTGYVRPLYENPMFLKNIAFGNNGYPWSFNSNLGVYSYKKGQAPVTHELIHEKFLWFYQIAHPSTYDDMDDIVTAIEKILTHKDVIIANQSVILNDGDFSLRQGRI